MKYQTVFIDDEKDILDLYRMIAEDHNEQVVCFTHPKEAFDYIRNNYRIIKLIVSDFKMPDINGLELREKLLKELSEIPFVVLSAYAKEENALADNSMQIAEVLEKPITEEKLTELIKKYGSPRSEYLDSEFELIQNFIEESELIIADVEEFLLELEEFKDNQFEIFNSLLRVLHTIKGTASCVGLKNLARYTHRFEDYAIFLKNSTIELSEEIISHLFNGIDTIKEMFECIKSGDAWDFDIDHLVKVFEIPEDAKFDLGGQNQTNTDGGKNNSSNEKLNIHMHEIKTVEKQNKLIYLNFLKFRDHFFKKYNYNEFRSYFEEFSDLVNEQMKIIANIKKVDLQNIFRLQKRVVRETATSLGKKAKLEIECSKIKVDLNISRVLNQVLIHVLRNCVDHGLENTQERKAAGKSDNGNIHILCHQDLESTYVLIKDDGKGINPKIIADKACEKGLMNTEKLESMSDEDILQLIFAPGFSTAEQVSDISGRGVGMDAVKTSIEGLGGNITVESTLGEGTSISIQFPNHSRQSKILKQSA